MKRFVIYLSTILSMLMHVACAMQESRQIAVRHCSVSDAELQFLKDCAVCCLIAANKAQEYHESCKNLCQPSSNRLYNRQDAEQHSSLICCWPKR